MTEHAPAASELHLGGPATVVADRYRLTGLLGRGGMAEVHRAHDTVLDRDVALKVFRPTLEAEGDRERFCAEVHLLAGLNHPHLVALYDAGIDEAQPWCALQLVDGGTLADLPVPADPPSLARIAAEVAEGLAHVHAHGVVHRDVKPGNVLLDGAGTAFLADFGIARLVDGSRLTQTGLMLGTAAFLSPEQVRGEGAVPASDVYALGLVVLEALTGRREYEGLPVEAAMARLSRPPLIPDHLPPGWHALLGAMTAADPADRPDANTAAGRLAALAAPAPVPAVPARAVPPRALPAPPAPARAVPAPSAPAASVPARAVPVLAAAVRSSGGRPLPAAPAQVPPPPPPTLPVPAPARPGPASRRGRRLALPAFLTAAAGVLAVLLSGWGPAPGLHRDAAPEQPAAPSSGAGSSRPPAEASGPGQQEPAGPATVQSRVTRPGTGAAGRLSAGTGGDADGAEVRGGGAARDAEAGTPGPGAGRGTGTGPGTGGAGPSDPADDADDGPGNGTGGVRDKDKDKDRTDGDARKDGATGKDGGKDGGTGKGRGTDEGTAGTQPQDGLPEAAGDGADGPGPAGGGTAEAPAPMSPATSQVLA